MDNNLIKSKKLAEDYNIFSSIFRGNVILYIFRKLIKCWKLPYEIVKK